MKKLGRNVSDPRSQLFWENVEASARSLSAQPRWSGFAVRNTANTKYGVVTAAHCTSNLSQLEEENGATFRPLTFQSQAAAFAHGDAEWHVTTGTVGQFWASPNLTVSQLSYRFTNAMVGQTVCGYGRASNVQKCDYNITSVGGCFAAGSPVNQTICDMVLTNNPSNTLTFGDSGGPVHLGTTVYGVHSSTTSTTRIFTPVQLFQQSYGILVFN